MKIKPSYRLQMSDLPLIESPDIAGIKVARLLNTSPYDTPLDTTQVDHLGSPLHLHNLSERVARGELLLVYSDIDRRELFSPLISWKEDSSHPGKGFWRLNDATLPRISDLKSNVDTLNRHGVTPRELSSAIGIGGLDADNLSAGIRHHRAE